MFHQKVSTERCSERHVPTATCCRSRATVPALKTPAGSLCPSEKRDRVAAAFSRLLAFYAQATLETVLGLVTKTSIGKSGPRVAPEPPPGQQRRVSHGLTGSDI